ncbi:MAG: ABC transporter permease [Ruminococcus sp.]
MTAILKKELSSFFTSAVGYVVMAVYYFFAGLFFYYYCLILDSKDMATLFSNMFMITVLVIPIITMKSLSEEKKQKTDQALLTSPLGLGEIVTGKFLGSLIMFLCCVAIYVVFAFTLSVYSAPDWSVFIGNLLGTILLGATMISINIFISSLTESMIISAIVGMCVGLAIFFIDSIASLVSVTWISTAISSLSFVGHYQNFTTGILSVSDMVFFLSVIALFNFLTLRVLEKRRWS